MTPSYNESQGTLSMVSIIAISSKCFRSNMYKGSRVFTQVHLFTSFCRFMVSSPFIGPKRMSSVAQRAFLLSLLLVSNQCSHAANISSLENDQVTKTRENRERERILDPLTSPPLFTSVVSLKTPAHHQGKTLPGLFNNITKTESITSRSNDERQPERNLHPVTFPAFFGPTVSLKTQAQRQEVKIPSISDNMPKTQSGTVPTPTVAPAFPKTAGTTPYIIFPKILHLAAVTDPVVLPPAQMFLPSTSLTGPFRHVFGTEHVCGPKGVCDKKAGMFLCESVGFQCHACRCDEDCFRFGDCCPDKYNITDIQSSTEPDTCFSTIIKPSGAIPDQR